MPIASNVSRSGLRLAIFLTVCLTALVLIGAAAASHLSYTYWDNNNTVEDTWHSQAAFGTIDGGRATVGSIASWVTIKSVRNNGSLVSQATAQGGVILYHGYVYAKSSCKWYYAHIGQSQWLQCKYTF